MLGSPETASVRLLRKNYAVVSVGSAAARQPTILAASVMAQATVNAQRAAYVGVPESGSESTSKAAAVSRMLLDRYRNATSTRNPLGITYPAVQCARVARPATANNAKKPNATRWPVAVAMPNATINPSMIQPPNSTRLGRTRARSFGMSFLSR